jgi:hypothetical protein
MTQYHGGPPPPPYYGSPMPYRVPAPPTKRNGLGTTALVLAVIGLALCWSVIGGVLLGIVAIVLGASGRARVARSEADNRTVATSGIALGVLAVVVSLAVIPVWTRFYSEIGMPAYFACVSGTTDPAAARRCADDLQKRIDTLFDPAKTGR